MDAPLPTPARPQALAVEPSRIPSTLQATERWVVWRYVEEVDAETGEVDWDKPPLNARTDGAASTTNAKTWSTFDDAMIAYERGDLDGIGFVLHRAKKDGAEQAGGVVGVDLDHCRDPATGEVAPWAWEIIRELNTYTELSPSGKGVRLFLVGDLPPTGRKKKNYENYQSGRYVTVTGRWVEGTPLTVEHRQEELLRVHARFWPVVPPAETNGARKAVEPSNLDDVELIRRASEAKRGAGERFSRLWQGDLAGHGSASEADLALVNYLAFWCGPDEGRIADLFARSGLYRTKWNREDYRRRTIAKAMAGRTEFYAPAGGKNGSADKVAAFSAAADAKAGKGKPSFEAASEEIIIIRASEITPKKIEWLWPGRIPLGKMTTFAGVGGLGKTFVLCDIAARVTTGCNWPDSTDVCAPMGQVLFISGEDDPDDTLVPRMIELGADREKVVFLKAEVQDSFHLGALKTLTKAVGQAGDGVRLVVIDPPTGFLGDGIDDHKNAELRRLLGPLKTWVSQNRVALIFNTHVNKPQGAKVEAMMRVIGGVAWVNAVRAAHMFARDPEDYDRVIFVPMKMNVGKRKTGLAYKIKPTTEDMATIEWLGDVDTTADEAMNREPKPTKREKAGAEFLIECFRKRLEWESEDLFRAAKEAHVSRNAVYDAKKLLNIPKARKVTHENGDEMWVWWVPAGWPPLTDEASVSKKTGTVEKNGKENDETRI